MMLRKFLLRWLAVVILALALVPGTAGSAPTGIEVAEPFRAYYNDHQAGQLMSVHGYRHRCFLLERNVESATPIVAAGGI
jgi:hypothetical protein